ncbi:MAG: hypothetical protein ACETWR_04380 [Anaerolineae bacterium]
MTTTHQDFDLCLEKTAQHEFVAYVPDGNGDRAAEHAFSLRTDTLKMREDLQRLEVYSLHKELVKDDFHVQFGRMLYQAALGGDVGALFAERLAAAQSDDMGLRLRVRVDEGAPELMNLPWEFLHDEDLYYNFCLPHSSLRRELPEPIPTKGSGPRRNGNK